LQDAKGPASDSSGTVTQGGKSLSTGKGNAKTEGRSVPDHEKLRRLEEKYGHELMDYEERCQIWSRIAAARRELARQKA
jgi:hypothetical protein